VAFNNNLDLLEVALLEGRERPDLLVLSSPNVEELLSQVGTLKAEAKAGLVDSPRWRRRLALMADLVSRAGNLTKIVSAIQDRLRPNVVVLLVHGIRDIARWQTAIASTLREAGFEVELTNYGRMNLIEFLLPIPFFRNRAIDAVWTQIRSAAMLHPGADISIVAHSFGTYIVSSILRREFDLSLRRIIFCSSVVHYDFPFEQINRRFDAPILNDVGTVDPWPALAESVTAGYGSAGTYGFRRPGIRDRFHNKAGHGYFLNAEFCRRYWLPFLLDGTVAEASNRDPENPPLWVSIISIFKIKYIILLSVACLLLLHAARTNWVP
jgi:hypothetical protein